jgi:hypothetical protein
VAVLDDDRAVAGEAPYRKDLLSRDRPLLQLDWNPAQDLFEVEVTVLRRRPQIGIRRVGRTEIGRGYSACGSTRTSDTRQRVLPNDVIVDFEGCRDDLLDPSRPPWSRTSAA